MKLTQEKISEIALANDIIDVISNYIQVKQRGKSYLALCPFHPDKNPSLNISREKQVYHCFACGASGNVFIFLQNYEKITFAEAAEKLAARAGISLVFKGYDTSTEISKLLEINKAAAKYYNKNLIPLFEPIEQANKKISKFKEYSDKKRRKKGNESFDGSVFINEYEFVREYVKKRNIKKQTINKFGIGYALKKWNGLLSYFISEEPFTKEDIEKAGLVVKAHIDLSLDTKEKKVQTTDSLIDLSPNDKPNLNEKSSKEDKKYRYYDRFRGRLMFPVFNETGKVVAFGGRVLYEDDTLGKYINSPETKIYSKSKILYGLNFAKESIKSQDYVILVEGYMDLIALSQAGINNVVASSGTALTEEQVKLISRYTRNIVLMYDADLAGIKAAKRGIELILSEGLELTVVSLPEGEDPDSLINKEGKDKFIMFLEQRKSIISFITSLYEKNNLLDTPEGKIEMIKEIINFISFIPDKLRRAFLIKEIANTYNIYESDLRDELDNALSKNKKSVGSESFAKEIKTIKAHKIQRKTPLEELELLEIFVNGTRDAIEYIENNLEFDMISDKDIYNIMLVLMNEYLNEGKIEVFKALNMLNEEQAKILAKVSVPPYELSAVGNTSKIEITVMGSKSQINYLQWSKDLVKRLKIKSLERRKEVAKSEGAEPDLLIEIQKQINSLIKQNKN